MHDGIDFAFSFSGTPYYAHANNPGSDRTVQGYDLNYGFVILGPDIRFDRNSRSSNS